MYTREDEDQARRLWKKRLGLALVPMIVGLAAGIALFVVGRMRRSDTPVSYTHLTLPTKA